jgi:deoxyribonuclease IV
MTRSTTFLIGAHQSIAGGLHNALIAAESIGCTCVQFFTHSNRQWAFPPLTEQQIETFVIVRAQSSLQSLMVHASYLLNIGSSNAELRNKSTKILIQELVTCELLNVPYLVLHPGSCGSSTEQDCLAHIAEQLNYALSKTKGTTTILVENTAGQGSSVGYSFEQLAFIMNAIETKKRIGICFDTCHAFAAGYDFRTPETYQALWKSFDESIGLNHLKALHLNDAKKGLGQHVDRHEHIGHGTLGLEPFRLLCNDERFFDMPKILETPKDASLHDDIGNLTTLKNLLTAKNRKLLHVV